MKRKGLESVGAPNREGLHLFLQVKSSKSLEGLSCLLYEIEQAIFSNRLGYWSGSRHGARGCGDWCSSGAGSGRAGFDQGFAHSRAGHRLSASLRLKFSEARAQFEAWQKSHPQDPLGYASEAASYLFEECYRQGVISIL